MWYEKVKLKVTHLKITIPFIPPLLKDEAGQNTIESSVKIGDAQMQVSMEAILLQSKESLNLHDATRKGLCETSLVTT